jgi:hypothetical protein
MSHFTGEKARPTSRSVDHQSSFFVDVDRRANPRWLPGDFLANGQTSSEIRDATPIVGRLFHSLEETSSPGLGEENEMFSTGVFGEESDRSAGWVRPPEVDTASNDNRSRGTLDKYAPNLAVTYHKIIGPLQTYVATENLHGCESGHKRDGRPGDNWPSGCESEAGRHSSWGTQPIPKTATPSSCLASRRHQHRSAIERGRRQILGRRDFLSNLQ